MKKEIKKLTVVYGYACGWTGRTVGAINLPQDILALVALANPKPLGKNINRSDLSNRFGFFCGSISTYSKEPDSKDFVHALKEFDFDSTLYNHQPNQKNDECCS